MDRYRLHHSLGRRKVIRRLHRFTKRHFSTSKRHPQQKITDAYLLALLLARFIFKIPFASIWWNMLREDRSGRPSYTQAFNRGQRLLEQLEAIVSPAQECAEVIIDSMPLPVCRPKRGKRCAFPAACWGFGTQGHFYGFKLHAWISPSGRILHYLIRPANLHDLTVAHELNARWPDFGGPKIIGDKGYCCLGFTFPPKKNTRYDTGWLDSRHPVLRRRIESVFAQLVEAQIRATQTKTMRSLRLRVVLAVLAHNLSQA